MGQTQFQVCFTITDLMIPVSILIGEVDLPIPLILLLAPPLFLTIPPPLDSLYGSWLQCHTKEKKTVPAVLSFF